MEQSIKRPQAWISSSFVQKNMSATLRSPSPHRSQDLRKPDSSAAEKEGCALTPKHAVTRRKLSAEATQRKLEYNRNYMTKKRALTRTKLKEIKKWLLEEPDMIDSIKQMEILKKMVNEKL